MPMNNSQLSNMWGGMAGKGAYNPMPPMGGRGMMEVRGVRFRFLLD